MDARLHVLFGPLSGQTISVPVGEVILGRQEDCPLGPLSDFVSRRHCAMLIEDDTLIIRDLGSKNGTLVNGSRVGMSNTVLAHGDIISVGDLLIQVEVVPTAKRPSSVIDGRPGVAPAALMGTGVFEGDTIQAKDPTGKSPQNASPDSAPIVSGDSSTKSDNCLRNP